MPCMPNVQNGLGGLDSKGAEQEGIAHCRITHAGGVGGSAREDGAFMNAALRWGDTTWHVPFAIPFLVCGAQAGRDECGVEGVVWHNVWAARLESGVRGDDVRVLRLLRASSDCTSSARLHIAPEQEPHFFHRVFFFKFSFLRDLR